MSWFWGPDGLSPFRSDRAGRWVFVGRLEAFGDLAGSLERVVNRERPASDPLGEIFALDELHDEEAVPLVLLEAVEGWPYRSGPG